MKRFVFIIGALLLSLALRAQEVTYTCRYWFDQNHAQAVTTTFGESGWEAELDVGQLTEGLHALHLHVLAADTLALLGIENNTLYHVADTVIMKWSAPQTYLFLKASSTPITELTYHYWFDQNHLAMQSGIIGSGHLQLDVADLDEGLHVLHVMLEGGALTATQSYMFMKMPVEDTSMALQYHCWFDQDYSNVQTGLVGSGLVELDVADLPNGIHTVNVQLDNGTRTAPQTYLFYKQPLGGYGIARWEYWLNDDIANRQITNISPTVDTLDIISLLNVGHPALRSSCFHFHPNGDAPYINAKNQINFRFYDSELRLIDRSAYFVDEQVQQDIVAQVFERNTTETFAAPRDNQIHWFKINAESGEYLSFCADKTCTMQLFSPSGEEIYSVLGPESILLEGFNVWEDGSYYLAVHDVMGSGETISVTYNWLNRYAIASFDVHQVGNGGCSTITFQGNGYNNLLDVYLVNAPNDTIHRLDIGHESNSSTTVTFNFYGVNLGVYDAVFEFYEETIRINGALEVQEPIDIVLTSSVSYPSRFLRNTACTYTYTITNNGNMTAYDVPISIYVATETENGISRLSIEGLKLDKLYDYIKDSYEWSEQERKNLLAYSDYIGEDIYFVQSRDVDEVTGDSVFIRSSFFMTAIPPLTTKTITIQLIASEPVDTWFLNPEEWITYTIQDFRTSNEACCFFETAADVLNGVSVGAGATALTCQVLAVAAGATGIGVAAIPIIEGIAGGGALISCATGIMSSFYSLMDEVACSDNNMSPRDLALSIAGTTAGCLSSGLGELKEAVRPFLQYAGSGTSLGVGMMSSNHNSKRPNCDGEDSKGGQSTPVNSLDPNDIHGYLSESSSHYMRQEIQNVQYEIEFENDTTLATAAAHTIIIRDTLDATKFDLNSLAARSVTIGDKRLELNGEQTFARTLDMRPELYVIAQIEQDYDPATGIVEWTIQSLDPMTMEPTDNPYQGVLPVNYFGNGMGFIDYSINLKQAFADGTAISNRAGIIFDQNDVIMTPTWTNTVDAVNPTSHIEEVTPVVDSLSFSFVSEDNRSGVWYHILYYRNDSTQMQWQVKKPQITENSLMLFFDDFQTTEYLVMAVDSAGNVEEKDMVAEYIHYYDGPVPITQCEDLLKGWNWFAPMVSTTIDDIENALNEYHENILSEHERVSSSIEPGEMLKIQTNVNCTLSLTGFPFAMATVEITQGTNWIGCIGTEKAVGEVFNADFGPAEGDKIISQDSGFAIFNGTSWQGTLETLQPGHGYVYYSTANAPKTLFMGQ